jgi:hypothetical protein
MEGGANRPATARSGAAKDAALANLDAWVPAIFPEASYQPGTGAYRIKSSQLGRNLQEDLAIHPDGITDWGTRETLTAIDLVMWRNGGTDKDAAFWLCDRLGRSPDSFGWNKNLDSNLRPFTHTPGTGAAQGRAKGGPPSIRPARSWRNCSRKSWRRRCTSTGCGGRLVG